MFAPVLRQLAIQTAIALRTLFPMPSCYHPTFLLLSFSVDEAA
jgi:hypothetical protein